MKSQSWLGLADVLLGGGVMTQGGAAYPEKNIQYIVAFVAGGGLAWSQLNGMSADGYSIVGCNLPHIVLQPLEGQVQYKTEDITPAHWFHYTADALIVAADRP